MVIKDVTIQTMQINSKLQNKWNELLEALRFRLARPDASFQLAILGLVTGLLAGGGRGAIPLN